ncbi:separin, partial [Thraustotheca clavata]
EKAIAAIVANSPEKVKNGIDPLYIDALQDACQLLGWTTFHHQLRRFSKNRWSLNLAKADKLITSGEVDSAIDTLKSSQNELEKVEEKLVKYDQGRKLQLQLARAYCANGFYEEAIVELKTCLKTCFQHVYYLGADTVVTGADVEQKKMYFQSIEFSAWSLLHDTLSCLGRLGDVYAKLGLPSKSIVYIRRAQTLALGLNYHIVAARRIALLGARVEMHKNNVPFAQSALERLVPISPNEVQEEAWMAQACYENLLEGDILHVQSHYGPAQKAYKLSKHRIIPYYQQHKRLIRVVARSYRKLAENACRAYYHDKNSEFPVEAITAFQKSIKLSTSVVENSQCLHGVGLGVYHCALIHSDAKKLELLSQSVQALRESWFHVVNMHSRPHLLYRVCRDLTLALIETVKHTDLEMQKKLHWNMTLTQAVGVRLDQGSELSNARNSPATPPEYFQWASDTFQSHFTSSGIPPDWNIVFISLTTSKELVIHRIQKNGTAPITVALPRTQFPMESYLNGLNKIITASNETLSGHTADEAQTWSSTQKKQWWNQRNHLDAQLQLLLEKAQAKLGYLLSLFVGRPSQLPRGVLQAYESIISQCGVNLLQQELLYSLLWALHQHLLPRDIAIAGIRSILPACNLSSVKFPVHSEPVAHGPTILICDEKAHAFPWEGLMVCKALAVSRMPNIFSVIANDKSSAVSRQRVRYMINPSGDLIHTESVMSPFLDKASRAWQWEGSKGPTTEAGSLMTSYVKESDVFLYSGHGSGEEFVHRDIVAGYDHASVCLLLGCSSAKLKQEGIYLPEGMLLSYLAAKSRAVLGMLWDVTDRDIDRLSLKLLQNWFEEDMTLASALQRSRSECKLRSLNGLAAVCYGLPLLVDKGPIDVSME